MRMLCRKLITNDRGAALLEFALVAPFLIMIANGILQLGLLFASNAGMKQAVEVGARYATIFPRPNASQIEARIRESGYFIQPSRITELSVVGPTPAAPFVAIKMSYSMPLNFIFFQVDTVVLKHERVAYQA